MTTASGYLSRYALIINRTKPVLKWRDGPAIRVTPGTYPPLSLPENATLNAGTGVLIMSFALYSFDSVRTALSLIVDCDLSLSNSFDILCTDFLFVFVI